MPKVINGSETHVFPVLHTVVKIEIKMMDKLNYFFIMTVQGHLYSSVINFNCVYE